MSARRAPPEDETNSYLSDIYTMISAPTESTAMNGTLQSPMNVHSQLYVMEGSRTLVTEASATRVTVLLDAEATLRNGQARAQMYQYNTAGAMIRMDDIDISAGSSNFSCGSVVSARMDVKNSSSFNEVAGHMTGAVLNAIPADVHNLNQTRLKQKTPRQGDQVSAQMKDDGVSLLSLTSHLGAKNTSLLPNVYSNQQSWYVKYDVTDPTVTSGFSAVSVNFPGSSTPGTAVSFPTIANKANSLWDTANLTTSPFRQSTFGIVTDFTGVIVGTSATSDPKKLTFSCGVFDQSGALMAEEDRIMTVVEIVANEDIQVSERFEFTRMPRPIGRVVLHLKDSEVADLKIPGGGAFIADVRGLEDVSDLPDRDLMVIVSEGVNSGAAITIDCGLVVSGIPAADRTFIAGGAPTSRINDSLIQAYLHSALKDVPRASGLSEIGDLRSVMKHVMAMPQHESALHAWGFSDIGRAFGKIASTVRGGVRGFDHVLSKVMPVVSKVGEFAHHFEGLPYIGQAAGAIGNAADRATSIGENIHNVTQFAGHPGSKYRASQRMIAMGDY